MNEYGRPTDYRLQNDELDWTAPAHVSRDNLTPDEQPFDPRRLTGRYDTWIVDKIGDLLVTCAHPSVLPSRDFFSGHHHHHHFTKLEDLD